MVTYISIYGFNKWRTELVGKSKYELARKIILITYELRDSFNHFYLLPKPEEYLADQEIEDRLKDTSYSANAFGFMKERNIRFRRLNTIDEIMQRLKTARWEAEVLLDQDDADLMLQFEAIHKKLMAAVIVYYNELIMQDRSPYFGIDSHKMDEYQSIIYGLDNSPLIIELDESITMLRESFKKYIRG